MHQSEDILFSTLLQLIVIILAARCANQLLRRIGQPGSVGEIIAGLLLGPSLLGYALPAVSGFLFSPSAVMPITIISQIGLIFLMFQIGSEFEFAHLEDERNRKTTMAIAFVGIASTVMGMMNTRALMELIVLNIGFDLGFIPQHVFTMLVIMAVATTMMTAPLLRILLPRTGYVIPLRVDA
jgi:Kef-type K+ transport system membrane component KefB